MPHTTIVKKEKKCRFTWVIALILLLWVLATVVIIFHIAPECVYRKLRALTDTETPRMGTAERFVFDIAEPDIKIAPKLPSIKYTTDEVNTNTEEERLQLPNTKNETKSNKKTEDEEDEEATKAIQTLLKRPDVQQVVLVGTSDDTEQNQKGLFVIDGKTDNDDSSDKSNEKTTQEEITKIINQLQGNRNLMPDDQTTDTKQDDNTEQTFNSAAFNSNYPQQSVITPEEYYNNMYRYHQAMMRWQMERELQRQQMMLSMQRARAQTSEMPRFMMGPHHPMMMYRVPMYPTPSYHMVFPSQDMVSQQNEQQSTFDQTAENTTPAPVMTLPRRLHHQFPVQVETDRQNMVPQQQTLPELIPPVHLDQNTGLPAVRPHDASATQIFQAMHNENVDRDAIYRKLLAQSQIEANKNEQTATTSEQNQQPEENNDDIFWRLQRISQNRGDVPVPNIDESPMRQKTSDEIFRELQQKSMEMHKEQEMREKAATQTPIIQDVSEDEPVILFADTFPKRTTVAIVDGDATTTVATVDGDATTTTQAPEQPFEEATNEEANSTDPLAAFFRFFEQEAVKLNNQRESAFIDITASTQIPTTEPIPEVGDFDESSGMEVDQPEPAQETEPVQAETHSPDEDASSVVDITDEHLINSDWNRDQYPLLENIDRPIVRID